MRQKVVRGTRPEEFEAALQDELDDGWRVVPGTMMARYEGKCSFGVFLCVVEREKA